MIRAEGPPRNLRHGRWKWEKWEGEIGEKGKAKREESGLEWKTTSFGFPRIKKDSPSVNPRLNWGKGKSMDGRRQMIR